MSALSRCPLCGSELTTGHACVRANPSPLTMNEFEAWSRPQPAPPPLDVCLSCARLEREAARLAELSTLQSAAVLGHLQAGHPYAGKPLAPVEEAIRLRRALWHLAMMVETERARGQYDIEPADVEARIKAAEEQAAKEVQVPYVKGGLGG